MRQHKWQYNKDTSSWLWRHATFADIPAMVALAEQQFQLEIDEIFTPEPELYAYNLALAITHQIYNQAHEQLVVAVDKTSNNLLAYAWIGRGTTTPYSSDEIAEAKMAHVDLTLSTRQRLQLLAQMLEHWINWTRACEIPVLVSTSIRSEQTAFMRLHTELGFIVRGSIGYLKL
ncbi:hypothetical protein UFOVP180_33 [uncultured Caudovirales phage]|uniref:Uncharacterized protein n=1 Tax=uncultured Caudovirales phage TaxID=2100421 RepID=A0A6J7WD03_9CAUD|nr:hypothetical protein UFOVP180_33 [uncultured Caudovirales phage]